MGKKKEVNYKNYKLVFVELLPTLTELENLFCSEEIH